MKKIIIFLSIILLISSLYIVLASDQSPPKTLYINSCRQDINASGNYILTQDFNATNGICLVVDVNNVNIDCQGHAITCNQSYDLCDIIHIDRTVGQPHANNVTIQNCVFKNAFEAVAIFGDNVLIKNNTFLSDYLGIAMGDWMASSRFTNITLDNNLFRNNTQPTTPYNGIPIFMTHVDNVVLKNNRICEDMYVPPAYRPYLLNCEYTGSVMGNNNYFNPTYSNCGIQANACNKKEIKTTSNK